MQFYIWKEYVASTRTNETPRTAHVKYWHGGLHVCERSDLDRKINIWKVR